MVYFKICLNVSNKGRKDIILLSGESRLVLVNESSSDDASEDESGAHVASLGNDFRGGHQGQGSGLWHHGHEHLFDVHGLEVNLVDLNHGWARAVSGGLGDGHNIERNAVQTGGITTIVDQNGLESWAQVSVDLGNVSLLLDECTLEVVNNWPENLLGSLVHLLLELPLASLVLTPVKVSLVSFDVAVVCDGAVGLSIRPWSIHFDTLIN